VAAAEGHLKERPTKSPYDAVSTRTRSDHSQQVYEIDFDHHSEALVLGGV